MAQIVLASGSPRRRELLERIGLTDFVVRVPEVEESFPGGLPPQEVVSYISREKAEAAAKRCARRRRSSSPRTPWSFWMTVGWASPGTRPTPWRC